MRSPRREPRPFGRFREPRTADVLPRPLWIAVALVPVGIWLLIVRVDSASLFLDWSIYSRGWVLWRTAGTPYEVLAGGWNPCLSFPYVYPPSSWPLMPLAAALPAPLVAIGVVPVLVRPPRLWFVPLAVFCLAIGFGTALYLGNVNALVAGLLVLSFVPGRVGGIAFGLVVGLKLYPIILLPLLWGDRTRLRWFAVTFGGLAASGTLLLGPRSWLDFATTLVNEGPHCGTTWNPLAILGPLHYAAAGGIAALGLLAGSPTLTIVGVTWLSGVVTGHYLMTFAAALCVEPALAVTGAKLRRVAGAIRRGLDYSSSSPAGESPPGAGTATPAGPSDRGSLPLGQ
jgi:hypothetical protein